MAVGKVFIIYFFLVAVFLGDVSAKRGGSSSGRSSSRGGRSRVFGGSSSVSRARSYSHVPLHGRIITGSSVYTASSWRHAATIGIIYGGPSYIHRYPHRHNMPPICTNNYEKDAQGRVYGYFICPRDGEDDAYIYCCGAEKREFCCNKNMAQEYLATGHYGRHDDDGLPVGAIIGCVLTGIIVICICIYCYVKKKTPGVIIQRFSRKGKVLHTANGLQPVPLNDPVPLNGPTYDGYIPETTPGMPAPPSYDTIINPGYGGPNDLPYGPPQPQPPSYDEKSCLPHPDIDRAPEPYFAPYPSAGATPYPSSAPYQFTGDAPYPPADGAPYPPADGTPYPHADGAPYPPSGGAPYPPSDGAPYPPSGGAPYPPADGAPYPPSGGAPYPTTDSAPYPPMDGTPYPRQGTAPDPSPSIPSAPPSSEDRFSPRGLADDESLPYPMDPARGKHHH